VVTLFTDVSLLQGQGLLDVYEGSIKAALENTFPELAWQGIPTN